MSAEMIATGGKWYFPDVAGKEVEQTVATWHLVSFTYQAGYQVASVGEATGPGGKTDTIVDAIKWFEWQGKPLLLIYNPGTRSNRVLDPGTFVWKNGGVNSYPIYLSSLEGVA